MIGNHVYGQPYRGFESLSLRRRPDFVGPLTFRVSCWSMGGWGRRGELAVIAAFAGAMVGSCSSFGSSDSAAPGVPSGADGDAAAAPSAAPTCTDGAKNGDETDVDCGGPACAKCRVGEGCAKTAD